MRRRIVQVLFFLSLTLFISGLASAEAAGQADADKGVQLYQQGQYEEAAVHLMRALEAGVEPSQSSDLWTILGNTFDSMDEYPSAIKCHKRALEINPKSYVAWTNLGAVYRHNDSYPEARECYQKALELNPEYPEAHASLGALYIFEGQPEKGLESLQKAIALNDSQAVSHANIAVAYAKLGRFEEAQESLKRATSLGYPNGSVIQGLIDAEKESR